jgi:membrane associated rhomboid family serine protease
VDSELTWNGGVRSNRAASDNSTLTNNTPDEMNGGGQDQTNRGGGGDGSGGGSNPILSAYEHWQTRNTVVTRTFVFTVIVFVILSFVGMDFSAYFSNVTAFTLYQFEVYRLALSILVDNGLISVIMMLLFFPAMGTQMESTMGSGPFMVLIMTTTVMTNLIFNVACILLSFLGMPQSIFLVCSGFWTVLFTLITIDCLKAPEAPRRMMFIPYDIPSKYFPLALYALFCLFQGLNLSFAVAIFVGWLFNQGHLEKAMMSERYLEEMEGSNGMLHSATSSTGWIFVQRGGMDPQSQYALLPTSSGHDGNAASSHGGGGSSGGGSSFPAPGVAANKPGDQFPGKGMKASAGSGSLFGGGPSVATSKDEMKAKRLAAYGTREVSEDV